METSEDNKKKNSKKLPISDAVGAFSIHPRSRAVLLEIYKGEEKTLNQWEKVIAAHGF